MLDVLLSAATLASHASCRGDEGFRARDLRFLAELFSNWIDHSYNGGVVTLHNNQVRRFVQQLEGEGYLRRISPSEIQIYRLTRLGILELASRLAAPPGDINPTRFLFSWQIVRLYGSLLREMAAAEGKSFPDSLRIELDALLDYQDMLKREIQSVTRAVEGYRRRSDKGKRAATLATALMSQGVRGRELYREVEKEYPYNLSAIKPLSLVLGNLPTRLGDYEITSGALSRSDYLWHPLSQILQTYLKTLSGILERNGD